MKMVVSLKAIAALVTVKVATAAVVVGFITAAFVDPAWAVPIQTLLLIILTIVGGNIRTKVTRTDTRTALTHDEVIAAKANATHAASAAAAAASVARDSNRIVQDIGAILRDGKLVVTAVEPVKPVVAEPVTPPPTAPEGP